MDTVKLLVPVLDASGQPLRAAAGEAAVYPVLQPATESDLNTRLLEMLQSTVNAQILRLERCVRHLAGGSEEPMYLLLSQEEGGYARFGFWLQEGGARRQVEAPYVDLVVTDYSLQTGFVESTFAHEMGHVLLRQLVPGITHGFARKPHSSLVVSDYPTALDEGFAIHFELLVRDATQNPHLLGKVHGKAQDLINCWMNNVDGRLRQEGVRANQFVHRKALPAAVPEPVTDLYELWREDETGPNFLVDRLKNGQAMLASEGVGATLFYRWVTCESMRATYREPAFYERFGTAPDQVTTYENVTLKLLTAVFELGRRPYDPGRPWLADLAGAYATLFPDEAAHVCGLFLETTWGTTVSPALARDLEAIARHGRLGHMQEFVSQFRPGFDRLMSLRDEVAAGRASLTDGLGPELWVLNEAFLVSRRHFGGGEREPFALNLNTATQVEWMTIPGLDLALARRIVDAREERGFFGSVEELRAVDGVTDGLVERLLAMQARMAEAGYIKRT